MPGDKTKEELKKEREEHERNSVVNHTAAEVRAMIVAFSEL